MMEISRGKFTAVICITALTFTLFGLTLNAAHVHREPKVNVWLDIQYGEGSGASATLFSGNLITNIGELYIRDRTAFTNGSVPTWSISLSNVGNPSAAWTQLDTEVNANGFSRATGTVTAWLNNNDYAWNVTKTFTATGTQQLQTAGLNWDSTPMSNNNLFAAATFTQTTFNSGDTLTITWIITIDAN